MSSFISFIQSISLLQFVVYALVIFIVCTLFIFITKPLLIKDGKSFQLSFQPFRKRGKISPHMLCQFKKDIVELDLFKYQIYRKIDFIQDRGQIKAQMKKVEVALRSARSKMLDNYASLLRNHSSSDVTGHPDYFSYDLLVQCLLMIYIKDYIRDSLSDPDFYIPVNTTIEFSNFAEKYANILYERGKEFVDLRYVSTGKVISRDELRQSVIHLLPFFTDLVKDAFANAKIIEINMQNQVIELRKIIKDREKAVLGFELSL